MNFDFANISNASTLRFTGHNLFLLMTPIEMLLVWRPEDKSIEEPLAADDFVIVFPQPRDFARYMEMQMDAFQKVAEQMNNAEPKIQVPN